VATTGCARHHVEAGWCHHMCLQHTPLSNRFDLRVRSG
jgi:hypothetical protein